ncbi:hypothetical protein Taro_005613 [Colocasia esculenta]|uniref:Uncharacterized protein n=1 Tax=Colocasia esculenta TaxID=4460 RepID=A0A843TSV5_COLES|nr:hypothetical protein [Colocasia esculenta]
MVVLWQLDAGGQMRRLGWVHCGGVNPELERPCEVASWVSWCQGGWRDGLGGARQIYTAKQICPGCRVKRLERKQEARRPIYRPEVLFSRGSLVGI